MRGVDRACHQRCYVYVRLLTHGVAAGYSCGAGSTEELEAVELLLQV